MKISAWINGELCGGMGELQWKLSRWGKSLANEMQWHSALCSFNYREIWTDFVFANVCLSFTYYIKYCIIFFSLFRTSDFIDILYFMTGFNRTVSSIENIILSVNSVSICETNFLKLHLAISLWNVLVSFSTFTPWNVLSVHSALIHFLILVLFILTILTLFLWEMKRITLTHSSSHCYKFLPPHFHCHSHTGYHVFYTLSWCQERSNALDS